MKKNEPGAGLGQFFERPDDIREAETMQPCPACRRSGVCQICQSTGSLIEEHLDGSYTSVACPSCHDCNGLCVVCKGQGWCTHSAASNWNLKHVPNKLPIP